VVREYDRVEAAGQVQCFSMFVCPFALVGFLVEEA
jgi:hypothetical protein